MLFSVCRYTVWDERAAQSLFLTLYDCVFSVCVCVCRFQPAGLVERIQAIAQNVSNMAVRVEQILQNSMAAGRGTIS